MVEGEIIEIDGKDYLVLGPFGAAIDMVRQLREAADLKKEKRHWEPPNQKTLPGYKRK